MEYCTRENVKVVEEFVDDEVAKVEIDNKEYSTNNAYHKLIDQHKWMEGKVISWCS